MVRQDKMDVAHGIDFVHVYVVKSAELRRLFKELTHQAFDRTGLLLGIKNANFLNYKMWAVVASCQDTSSS